MIRFATEMICFRSGRALGRRSRSAATRLVLPWLLWCGAAPVAGQGLGLDRRITSALNQVSPERLAEYLETLTDFETRHSLSLSDRDDWGVRPAREYILETFQSFSPRLQVDLDCYQVTPQGRIPEEAELCNVVAVLPGRSARRIYVSGHYDSVARRGDGSFDWGRWDNPAPGANDDGSGTVLTMEVARVLSQSGLDFDATLVFVAFVAEEEGLVGASLHAARALEEGWSIDAVFNNDIVGNSTGGNGIQDSRTVRVFSEDPMDSPSRQLARYIRRYASLYVPGHEVRLIAREDRFGRGGDHTAFNRQGFTGVRFSESRENYSRQHMPEDTFDGVDFAYLARNTRVNAAAVASLALAPPAPDVMGRGGPRLTRGESGYDAELAWARSPGAVGYRIVWREAWTPDWQYEVYVGDDDGLTLPDISIDDYVFGIAAVGSDGHESLVAAYVRPPRPRNDVQTR
ncbi:MAG: M20/M25/M40 family metallo-hydrolase [Gemmatimonadota bacterium]